MTRNVCDFENVVFLKKKITLLYLSTSYLILPSWKCCGVFCTEIVCKIRNSVLFSQLGIFFICPFCIESSKFRHQHQRTERSKEKRPSKPVRKVQKVALVSEQNFKPGIVLFTVQYVG